MRGRPVTLFVPQDLQQPRLLPQAPPKAPAGRQGTGDGQGRLDAENPPKLLHIPQSPISSIPSFRQLSSGFPQTSLGPHKLWSLSPALAPPPTLSPGAEALTARQACG